MPQVSDSASNIQWVSDEEFLKVVTGKHELSKYNLHLIPAKYHQNVFDMASKRSASADGIVLIGADPEFFIATDKNLIASCGLIGGEKGKGIPINPDKNKDFLWLEDNVAVEMNGPAKATSDAFAIMWKSMVDEAILKLKLQGLHPVFKPALNFKPMDLAHPKAQTFGCDPDFCAYDADVNKHRTVDVQKFGNQRFAGGHIHLSFGNKDKIPAYAIAMFMDALIALPTLDYDMQDERRSSYGLAGLYRKKKYSETLEGVEYRTLSNFWLRILAKNTTGSLHYVHYMANAALALGRAIQSTPLELSKLFTRLPLRDIQSAINSEDKQRAKEIHTFIRNQPEVKDCALDFSLHPGMRIE